MNRDVCRIWAKNKAGRLENSLKLVLECLVVILGGISSLSNTLKIFIILVLKRSKTLLKTIVKRTLRL